MKANKATPGLHRPLWRIHTEMVPTFSGFWSEGQPVMHGQRPVVVCGDDRTIAQARLQISKWKGGLLR